MAEDLEDPPLTPPPVLGIVENIHEAMLNRQSIPTDPKEIEKRLFDAMDRAALILLESLESDNIAEKDGVTAFKMAMDWLAKSRRLRPKSDDDLPSGIEGMREFIRSEMENAVRPGTPKAKTARARRNAVRASKYSEEGSALAKALKQ